MLLLVGLGNPGPKYANHRHNVGFMALDEIARRWNLGPWRTRFRSDSAEGVIGGEKVLALKPQSFMNLSGHAVAEAVRFFKLTPSEVFVFYDELDLAPCKVKVKKGGGAAGHNGIRSLIQQLGPDFVRVRLGIGHPGDKRLVHNWVLSDFPKAERPEVRRLCEAIAEEVPLLVAGDEAGFMSRVAWRMQPPRSARGETGDESGTGDGPERNM